MEIDFSAGWMLASLLVSTVGFGLFLYGKKQQKLVPLIAGIGLCVFPYFMANPYAMMIVGAILTAAPLSRLNALQSSRLDRPHPRQRRGPRPGIEGS